jgi:hypothetical protein
MNMHTPPEDVRREVIETILDELVQGSADEAAIEAIGDLGDERYVVPGQDGLDVYGHRNSRRPYMTLPRGLKPVTARLLIDVWETGYRQGVKNGAGEIQQGLKRLLAIV